MGFLHRPKEGYPASLLDLLSELPSLSSWVHDLFRSHEPSRTPARSTTQYPPPGLRRETRLECECRGAAGFDDMRPRSMVNVVEDLIVGRHREGRAATLSDWFVPIFEVYSELGLVLPGTCRREIQSQNLIGLSAEFCDHRLFVEIRPHLGRIDRLDLDRHISVAIVPR